jgi:hypothetical protein
MEKFRQKARGRFAETAVQKSYCRNRNLPFIGQPSLFYEKAS